MSWGDREVDLVAGGAGLAAAADPAPAEELAHAAPSNDGGRPHTDGDDDSDAEMTEEATAGGEAGGAAAAPQQQPQLQQQQQLSQQQQQQQPSSSSGPRRWTEAEASAFFRALSRGSGCALGDGSYDWERVAQLVAAQATLEPLVARFATGDRPPVAEFNAAAQSVADAVRRVNTALGIS